MKTRDIWVMPMGEDGEPEPVLVRRFNDRSPSFSPDGRYLAYVSDESGDDQVYVRPYPGPGPATVVSPGRGLDPVWCSSGDELYFRDQQGLMAVSVDLDKLEVGSPRVLFTRQFRTSFVLTGLGDYDVASDCQRFLIIAEPETTRVRARVILNWAEELKRLVPVD